MKNIRNLMICQMICESKYYNAVPDDDIHLHNLDNLIYYEGINPTKDELTNIISSFGGWNTNRVNTTLKKELIKMTNMGKGFKERLLEETRELAIKANKLNDFMRTQGFADLDREDKDLLYTQSRLMNEYLQVLGKRLEKLGEPFTFKKQ